MIFNRLILSLGLLVLVFFTPWWLWFLVLAGLALAFNNFYEGVAVALVYDLIFGASHAFLGLPFVFTIAACLIILIISLVHYRLWH
ncbi:MAG: hypothetical protein A2114_02590 [Candidatus Vogelbacteria bacterium GWA1_51_14]|uniref:Uncharacterized protein n=1 Tax=Candidatus Vogelbacteria bacterium GWA1_51_14 TaxID=1802435 RepID=A0A1G2QCQ7_9BACT|nr:MAG: hypothetical protein A2114_02590 [Candidatus Vogelbacteria bacterium GWA1_51_14]